MKIKFSYIILTLALAVAGTAAYFSVWGLSQLFAGASTAVIVMASILETAKIVSTTALHKYWDKLAKGLRVYLTTSVVVLMIITSAGIYGFLSNAYQKTANKLELHEGEVGVLDGKKKIFSDALLANNKIIDSKNKRIDQLSGLRSTQESRIDAAKSNTSALRGDINSSNTEIQRLSTEIDGLNAKNAVLNDSISKYQTKVLEVKSGSDIAGEVGPLKYISELTGTPMDKVVNYMILLLIFVFDPLAVALILITNRVFQIENEAEEDKPEEKELLVVSDGLGNINISISNEEIQEPEYHEEEEVEHIDELVDEVIDEQIITETPIDDAISDTPNEVINEVINDVVIEEEPIIEEEVLEEPTPIILKKEPVKTTGKIELENIKEIKERERGFSVLIPEPKGNNTIERIGENKFLRNGDNKKIFYKRNGNQ